MLKKNCIHFAAAFVRAAPRTEGAEREPGRCTSLNVGAGVGPCVFGRGLALLPSLALFDGLHLELGLCCAWSGKKHHIISSSPGPRMEVSELGVDPPPPWVNKLASLGSAIFGGKSDAVDVKVPRRERTQNRQPREARNAARSRALVSMYM